MTQKRWEPPPMETEEDAGSKVRVDEKVVRKMLQVNPTLRQGRTTLQVKKALEKGEALGAAASSPKAPEAEITRSGAHELDDTVGFFLRGKSDRLREQLEGFAARRKALADEEEAALGELRGQITGFLSLLDAKLVDERGAAALGKHADLLKQLGLTPAQLLDSVRRGRR